MGVLLKEDVQDGVKQNAPRLRIRSLAVESAYTLKRTKETLGCRVKTIWTFFGATSSRRESFNVCEAGPIGPQRYGAASRYVRQVPLFATAGRRMCVSNLVESLLTAVESGHRERTAG